MIYKNEKIILPGPLLDTKVCNFCILYDDELSDPTEKQLKL